MGITKISTLVGTASTTGEYNLFADEKMINRLVGLIEHVASMQTQQPRGQPVLKSQLIRPPAAQIEAAPAPVKAAPAPVAGGKQGILTLDEAGTAQAIDAVVEALSRMSDADKAHSVNTIIMAYKMNIDGQKDKIRGAAANFLREYGSTIYKVE